MGLREEQRRCRVSCGEEVFQSKLDEFRRLFTRKDSIFKKISQERR